MDPFDPSVHKVKQLTPEANRLPTHFGGQRIGSFWDRHAVDGHEHRLCRSFERRGIHHMVEDNQRTSMVDGKGWLAEAYQIISGLLKISNIYSVTDSVAQVSPDVEG